MKSNTDVDNFPPPILIDPSEKKRQLETLEGEVSAFHPLLKQLLPKLKNIKQFEYTHGPNEKGADFVLTKYDETLDQIIYVGVIAKVGSIKSNNSDLERQIKECSILDRYVEGGKKKITLSELWVLTTGNITEIAKDKIHASFRSLNISFIGGEKLITLIDSNIPHYWLNVGLEIGHYLAAALIRMSDLDSQTNLLQFNGRGHFIDADIFEHEQANYERANKKRPHKKNIKDEVLARKTCVIEGQMGSGKSHLIRHLVATFSSPEFYKKHEWVPVYTDWKHFVEKHRLDVDSLIIGELRTFAPNLDIESLKFIIFVDGVDEYHSEKKEGDLSTVAQVIENVKGRDNVKLVLASRPMTALTAVAKASSTGYYEIQPLSLNKIISFVASVCRELNISKRIFDDIKRSELFRQLPQTPIAAILLSKLLSENQKELPSNLTELYAQSLEHMLGRWDIAKGLSTQKEYEASEQICFRLAQYLIDNNLPQIASSEAKEFSTSYLRERNLDLDGDKLFSNLTRRSGILAVDGERQTIAFRHRSLAEFLYAKSKSASRELEPGNRAFQIYWAHIYFFYIGLWKDCPDFLRTLLATTPSNEGERWLKIVNMSNYFLAAFSSPYEVVESNLYKLFIEAAKLYEDVLLGKSKTKLAGLSEMHLLWLMQMIVRESYSYDFFRRSIDSVKLQIEEDLTLSPNQKAVAQFIAAVTSMDLGEKKPFDFILEKKDLGELPLTVSYAISQESKSLTDEHHSSLLRKRNKKLRQLLSQNKGLRQQLKYKFDVSIITHLKSKPKIRKVV